MTPEILTTLIVIVGLLFLSGFFSGSETALTAASKARIHAMAKDGQKSAERVSTLIDDKEKLIGSILLGNNLINNLATALTTSALIALVGEAGVGYAVIAITILILIFSEVLPKTYAILNPERFAKVVALPISVVVFVFSPIVATVQAIVRATLRLFGANVTGPVLSAQDEIRGAIDLGHQEGQVVKSERDMLVGALDINELSVEDVMVHRKNIRMIDADLPPREIVMRALASPHTRMPLYRGDPDEVVGILHAKDLLRAIAAAAGDFNALKIDDVMREPWFVPETRGLKEQLDAFLRKRAHFALAVDEYGVIMGLVTLEDILEEIVGDIHDEHDAPVQGVRPQPDGAVNVDGWVAIRDLNRARGWDLPDDDAVTIAGLVIHEARTIPEPGQRFSFHDYEFEILRRARNQITALRVREAKADED